MPFIYVQQNIKFKSEEKAQRIFLDKRKKKNIREKEREP